MFAAVVIYESQPGTESFVVGIWVAAALMAVSVFPVFFLFLEEARREAGEGGSYRPRLLRSASGLAIAVAALVLGSELLMGRGFGVAAGELAGNPGLATGLATAVASPWFLFPMALEMSLTVLWLRARLSAPLAAMMATQAAMMLCSPPALGSVVWDVASGIGTTVAMSAVLAYLLRWTYRGAPLSPAARSYAIRFFGVSAVAGAGLAVWALDRQVALFALGMVLEMTVFFIAAVSVTGTETEAGARREKPEAESPPWGSNPA